ncbi:hypothetical protein GLAREA_03080 [Glarea lozoyensis ATCC 20868]|uniref:Uncharacterized protein n=1 Tax=Glarea lozoyensis (strain ATCC 20868 / MF5171) TaxID=1116229 RepID=S3D516_GLAL2|nr:uncharacterized protein GLAREA_03080 [Glarea lozoyensis ATCC 20868]EPE27166.1 hypothetical protein GLAREA_03080 [Glarea lozoyensis ATCC 20868]
MPGGKHSHNQHSDSQPSGSGLVKAVYDTGRERGASATPAPPTFSPQGNRRPAQQTDNMNPSHSHSGSIHTPSRTPNRNFPSMPSSQQTSPHHRNSSNSTHQSRPSQTSSSQFGGSQQQGANVSPSSQIVNVADLSRHLQASLDAFQHKIRTTPGLAASVQDVLIAECRKISQEFNQKQRAVQRQFDAITNEKHELSSQLEQAYRQLNSKSSQLNNANTELNRAKQERDSLKERVAELLRREEQQQKQWAALDLERKTMISEQQSLIAQLQQKVSFQAEQLGGRRGVWMDQHPESSPRRDAIMRLQDPFNSSPVSSQNTKHAPIGHADNGESSRPNNFSDMGSNKMVPTGPANMGSSKFSRRGALPLPSARPQQAPQVPMLQNNFLSTRVSPSERGSGSRPPSATGNKFSAGSQAVTMPFQTLSFGHAPNSSYSAVRNQPSSALVLRSSNSDFNQEYADQFSTIYALTEGWTKSYANQPNLVNDQNISQKNNVLWEFMMNCTYPGRAQDSHSHVMLLLNDYNTRRWFVMRMCVTYCVQEILDVEAFGGYSKQTDQTLSEIKEAEKTRGFTLERRQYLVDQKCRAIKSIISANNYQAYRADRLAYHTKKLRNILGPMLNDNVDRTTAGKDLGVIAVKAWDLSAKMNSSGLTFQIIFPETASKYNASSMIAKDQAPGRGMDLQIKQTRLKLVITPVITIRDDRGTTLIAKNIHQSTVLTMG